MYISELIASETPQVHKTEMEMALKPGDLVPRNFLDHAFHRKFFAKQQKCLRLISDKHIQNVTNNIACYRSLKESMLLLLILTYALNLPRHVCIS